MNRFSPFAFQVILFFWFIAGYSEALSVTWQYIYPKSGAKCLPCKTSLILRASEELSKNNVQSSLKIMVQGKQSGLHNGSIIYSDDKQTIIFKPDRPFTPSETVLVKINAEALNISPLEYEFTISDISEYNQNIWAVTSDDLQLSKNATLEKISGTATVINGVAVPSDFPKFNASILKETAKGKIFIGNWSWSGDAHYMMILENDGTPYFYKRLPGQTRDFKIQPTGTLTRRVYEPLYCYVEMDSQYVNIDTLRCQNGYGTDEHEVQLLPNHHCFLIGLDYRQVDMSKQISGGSTNATIIGNTVQELDEKHNVVFEWRSWDNFVITDAIHENLQGGVIDYVHMNSIAIDYDSNLVISSRHLNEVTKINRKTGKIIWRLGGVHNQFTFVNDAYGLSYQHDARPVPGKPNSYTMMDNGYHREPLFSRAVEFQLDTSSMTATKVWEYRHTPSDYYSYFMGNVQRLPNGNTFIDWADAPVPKATEVTPSGEVVYEANFEKNAACYRTFRFDWESVVKVPYLVAESYPDRVTLIFNKFGDKHVKRYIVYGGLLPNPITPMDSTSQTWIDLTKLISNQTYYFRVTARDSSDVESPYSNEENVLVKIIAVGSNLVVNGDFSLATSGWQFNATNGGVATSLIRGGEYTVTISNAGTQLSSIQLLQTGIALLNGKQYIFEFDAYASNNRMIDVRLEQNGGTFQNYSRTSSIALTKIKTHKSYTFGMTYANDLNARVTFNFGKYTDTVRLDNISVKQVVSTKNEEIPSVPTVFKLDQNYPNPFNPITTINYQLPDMDTKYLVSLIIYDMLGRKLTTLENKEKTSGAYQIQWNAADFASGIYYCELIAQPLLGSSNLHAVKKILLLK